MPQWSNWAGDQRCEPAVIERPRNRDELVDAIGRAAAAGRSVRAAGSGHSFTDIACTDGTMLLLMNNGQPGVLGAVGTILGRHAVNIASFALGRNEHGAVGVVTVDDPKGTSISREVLQEIRSVASVKQVWAVRV